ncbi:MAG TPA: hypothetical protein VFG74_10935 [Miltoncostaeaceae bacterium]|jgi:hypothetical protein|nr:hypothetical protein [Miltoncostaeaceae bacterium]
MARQVPRILRLSGDLTAPEGTRFALLHVVAGERHHVGWFQMTDDAWRVGLTEAGAVADAGVDAAAIRSQTEALLDGLRADRDAGRTDLPEPVGPVRNTLRWTVDRRRAIARLEAELGELPAA